MIRRISLGISMIAVSLFAYQIASSAIAHAAGGASLAAPVFHMTFDESSGATAIDSVSGNNGTRMNGAPVAIGKFGNALSLDGSTQYVSVPSAAALQDSSNGFTVCSWAVLKTFNNTRPGDQSVIAGKMTTPVDSSLTSSDPWSLWELYLQDDELNDAAYPSFAISDGMPGHWNNLTVQTKIVPGSWNLYCGTYDGSSMSLYLNGQNLGSQAVNNISAIGHNDIPMVVGTFGSADFPDYFMGSIDDLRIYNYTLSAAEIAELYNPTAPTITLTGNSSATTTVGTPFADPGAVATDAFDGILAVSTSTDPAVVDFNATGTYSITYAARNSRDMGASTTRTVTIEAAPVETGDVPPPTGGDDSSGAVSNGTDVPLPPTGGDDTSGAVSNSTSTSTPPTGGDDTNGAVSNESSTSTPPTGGADTTGATSTTTAQNSDVPPVGGGSNGGSAPSAFVAFGGYSGGGSAGGSSGGGSSSGGASGGSASGPTGGTIVTTSAAGQVLGTSTVNTNLGTTTASTTPAGQVLGAESDCGTYIPTNLSIGRNNQYDLVAKLQAFLNEVLGTNLTVNGHFGDATFDAVKEFQTTYAGDIIAPWVKAGFTMNGATGYVGPTTLHKINDMVCPELQLPMPSLAI